MSSKKGKTKMTKKAKAAKEIMGDLFDDNDPDASDDGWDDVMDNIYDRVWNPNTEKYDKKPELSLGSSSSELELLPSDSSDGARSRGSSVDSDGSGASYFDAFGNHVAETEAHKQRRWARLDDERYEREADEKEEEDINQLDDDLQVKVRSGEMSLRDAGYEMQKRLDQEEEENYEAWERYEKEMLEKQRPTTPDDWKKVQSKSTKKWYYWHPPTNTRFYPTKPGEWDQEQADEKLKKRRAEIAKEKQALAEKHYTEMKKKPAQSKQVVLGDGSGAMSVGSTSSSNDKNDKFTIRRLKDGKTDIKGKNGAYLRYKQNKRTGELTKVNPNNYTDEGNEAFKKIKDKFSKKGGKKSRRKRKKKKKTRRKKGGKRKKTKKRKSRKKRKTRR